MKKVFLLPVILLIICSPVSAQVTDNNASKYTGVVVDENGKPMPYVTAQLLRAADSTAIAGAATGSDGSFSIPCDRDSVLSNVLVRFSYIGYNTVIKNATTPDLGTVRMTPDAHALKEVLVKGHKEIIKSDVDRLQYIVGNDEFAKGMNAQELMKRVPMVEVSPANEVTVVGKSATHFLINGKTLPDNILQAKLQSLRSEDIERIEVITIPPAKYAAEGNAGYINIVTRKDDIYGFKGNVSGNLGYAEHLRYGAAPTVNYVSPKVEFSLGANVFRNKFSNDWDKLFKFDDHDKTESIKHYFTSMTYTIDGVFKYHPIKSLELGVMGGLGTNHQKSWGTDVAVENSAITNTMAEYPYKPNFSLSAEAYADWKIDSLGKDLIFTYDYTNNYEEDNDTIRSTTTDDVMSAIMSDGSNRYGIDSWKLDLTLPYKKLGVEAGLAYTNVRDNSAVSEYDGAGNSWELNAGLSNDFRYSERTAAAYASARYDFSPAISAKAGLRLEKTWVEGRLMDTGETHKDDYTHLFPTVYVNWNIPKIGSLRLDYGMGINRPTLFDLNPFRIYDSTKSYTSGNPYLVPSITQNVELNFNSDIGLYAVLYENHESDGIAYPTTFKPDGTQVTQPENCITSDKAGLYVSYNHDIFKWWNIMAGGDFFYSASHSNTDVAGIASVNGWSGKLEGNSSWFLDRAHKLVLNLSYTHYFPYYMGIVKYKTWAILGGSMRYTLLNDRLTLTLYFSDPFNQNIPKTIIKYDTYTAYQTFRYHPRGVTFNATWTFGGKKVKGVYHESKNTDSGRAGLR